MLLLITAAVNFASNEAASSVCVLTAGALVTIGGVSEPELSDCWACATDGKTAAVTSAAVVAQRWHLVGNRVRFSRITDCRYFSRFADKGPRVFADFFSNAIWRAITPV
jgi:hypothetical protein